MCVFELRVVVFDFREEYDFFKSVLLNSASPPRDRDLRRLQPKW